MSPLKIGACLQLDSIAAHKDWLCEADRDVELQDFVSASMLLGDWRDRAQALNAALDGHMGRRGIHGPYEGLDLDNKDPEVRPIITKRLLIALEAAESLCAQQMVLHSPFTAWYEANKLARPNYLEAKLDRIHEVLAPVLKRAEETGIKLVIENIQDVDPATRRAMVDSFKSDAMQLSIDTGHAQLARRAAGAPPVDYFVRDAGKQLAHVHLQDVDGHADRHWAPAQGEIEWHGVFRALAELDHEPHLLLELANTADILPAFQWLKDQGLAC